MHLGEIFRLISNRFHQEREQRRMGRLDRLSPAISHELVATLERRGMAVALELAVPGWRTREIVLDERVLETFESVIVPAQASGLPEERHVWSPLRARRLNDVVLDVDSGLVFAGDRVIAQSGSGTRASRDASFVSGATFRVSCGHPRVVKGPIAPLGDVNHHYHVLVETLPRLARVKGMDPATRIVSSVHVPDRYRSLLESLGLTIEVVPPGCLLQGEVVLVDQPELFWPRPSDVGCVRDVANSLGCRGVNQGRRLYVSRRSAARSIADEALLEEVLGEWGFECVVLEGLPIRDQIILFQESQCVVAPHGAGLSNIMFMGQGATVIELTSGDLFESCYRRMSAALGFKHRVMMIPGTPNEPFGSAHGAIKALQPLLA